MESSVGGVSITFNVAMLLMTPSWVAVISVVPSVTPVASPEEPIVAKPVFVLFHVAVAVKSSVLLSL